MEAVSHVWFEADGWLTAADSRLEREFLNSVFDGNTALADVLRPQVTALEAASRLVESEKVEASPDLQTRWLELCVAAADADNALADLARIAASIEELGRGFPDCYPLARHVRRVEAPLGRALTVSYDGKGNATSLELPDGTRYSYKYDIRENVKRQTDPLGQTGFAFTSDFNQLARATDAGGKSLFYAYDAAENLVSITYEDGTSELYAYASDGTLATWTNRRGQTVAYERDYYADGQIREFQELFPDGREFNYSYSYEERNEDTQLFRSGGTEPPPPCSPLRVCVSSFGLPMDVTARGTFPIQT